MQDPADMEGSARDPLFVLGPSLFLEILSHLEFKDVLYAEGTSKQWQHVVRSHDHTIWKPICASFGLDEREIGMRRRRAGYSHPVPAPPSDIIWRNEMEKYLGVGTSWKQGEMRQRWIVPERNHVHRFKVDHEEGVVISSSRRGGLYLTDIYTSRPTFRMLGVHPYAHVELANGFVVFNQDEHLYVYRTSSAVKRSSKPQPKGRDRRGAEYGQKIAGDTITDLGENDEEQAQCLSFYRIITPPTSCRAFRARLDHAGTRQERSMLVTAGFNAVYLWDLDDPDYTETIPLDARFRQLMYVEFDEEYVFLCFNGDFIVYSRRTKAKIVQFPETRTDIPGCLAVYEDEETSPDYRRAENESDLGMTPCPTVPTRFVCGTKDPSMIAAFLTAHLDVIVRLCFTGCHFNDTDLFIATTCGIAIVQDYRTVFSTDVEERHNLLVEHTLWISMADDYVDHIAVHGHRVAFSTRTRMGYFNSLDLVRPVLSPKRDEKSIQLPVFFCDMVNTAAIENAHCIQIDDCNIYTVYGAKYDPSPVDTVKGVQVPIPLAARGGGGYPIRVWNFAPFKGSRRRFWTSRQIVEPSPAVELERL